MQFTNESHQVPSSELIRCNVDATFTETQLQPRNSTPKNNELIRDMLKQRSNTPPIKKKPKDLDKHEVCSEVTSKIFQHQVDTTEVLLMYGELNDIKSLNDESSMFEDEIKKKTVELRQTCEPDDNQNNKKDSTLKRKKLNLNSQCNKILKVTEANETMMTNKIKLSKYDLFNETAERY